MPVIKFTLFSTAACHLCEEAEKIIASCDLGNVEIKIIDIAEQVQWQEKYAIRIPVLYHPVTERELGWPFTQPVVQSFINELSND